jgi:hypothetical protein
MRRRDPRLRGIRQGFDCAELKHRGCGSFSAKSMDGVGKMPLWRIAGLAARVLLGIEQPKAGRLPSRPKLNSSFLLGQPICRN